MGLHRCHGRRCTFGRDGLGTENRENKTNIQGNYRPAPYHGHELNARAPGCLFRFDTFKIEHQAGGRCGKSTSARDTMIYSPIRSELTRKDPQESRGELTDASQGSKTRNEDVPFSPPWMSCEHLVERPPIKRKE